MRDSMLQHEEGTPLQQWMNENDVKDEMFAKKAASNQAIFVRDRLAGLIASDYEEWKAGIVRVVQTHTSKSVVLPVYSIKKGGLEIRMRDNFYDWKVSIRSDRKIPNIFFDLFDLNVKINGVYCEGFSEDWVFGSFVKNPCEFTIELGDEYRVYTFSYLLKTGLGL